MDNYDDILVSIIIPVYNVRDYLTRCVESVQNQTHRNLEIILVNGSSTDGSEELGHSLAEKDPRIKVLRQRGTGLGEARNTGIDASTGEWVCFVDSDDFISDRYVEFLLSAVMEHGALLAQCQSIKGTMTALPPLKEEMIVKSHDLRGFFRYCSCASYHSITACWMSIYHRTVVDQVRFSKLRHAEDVPFASEAAYIASKCPLVTVEQILHCWYQRPGSMMNRRMDLSVLDQSRAYEQVIDFWKEKGERLIGNLFYGIYFSCLINEYFQLRRDVPEERTQYEYLVDKIKENTSAVSRLSPWELLAPLLWYDFLDVSGHGKIVLYGYGVRGAEILRWLQYFKIRPDEIWDRRAKENDSIEGIRFCKMHAGLPKDTLILVCIDNREIRWDLEDEFFALGYENLLEMDAINGAIRRRLYREMLPFLMEDKQ